ncbi:hypothetical protein N8289_00365, partial [Flavobacteriales bacterium]|nr:hypothetical protein [Flavobacteriales bacterium]
MDTSGLVGWWPFDGNANDYSGNGNHGIVNGAVFSAVDRNGNLNACYQWPNTRASGNYINLGTPIQSQLTNSITNSVWIYFDTAATANARIISTWEMGIIVYTSSSDSVTLKCTYDFTGTNMWPSTFKISKHSWHHIVFTSGSGFTRLYVDGQLVEVSSSTVAVQSSPYDWNVGRKSRPAYDGFGGKIDDLGIWNKVLDSTQIKILFQANSCNLTYNFPQDTITTCGQDSVLLDAGSGFASYNWSNGDSTQITYAKATGMYSVQVTDSNGCAAQDSVYVSISQRSIYYVNTTGNDLNPGSSVLPLRNIQTAIDRSCEGDTIIVEQGTYYEKISFLGKSLLVSSRFLFSNSSNDISNTIINGSRDITSTSGVTINGQLDSSYLIGFTIDSVFGSFGGAIRAFGKIKISDCVVSHSTTNGEGCGFYGHGIIENTKFTQNSGNDRGVITAVGNIKLSGCYFYQNTGIALYNWGNDIQIKNCIFNENSGKKGGAIYSTRSGDIEIVNSTFYNNSGSNYSSIFMTSEAGPVVGSKLSVVNSILWDSDTTSPLISTGNPIAFGPVNSGATQKINILHSSVLRGILGISTLIPTNLDTLNLFDFSPHFQDIANQNFRLKSKSPLLGLGSNNPSINLDTFLIPQLDYLKSQRIQPLGSIIDLGAIESALDTACQSSLSNIYVSACDSFNWVLNSMTYNSSGVYSDTITNSQGCDSIVSLNLTINTLSYQLPQDTITSCNQDSVLLDAGAGFASYNWSNGDSTQTTYAKATGMYSVQVTDTNGCTAEDSVFVSIIKDSILQNDTIICKGDSVSLSVGNSSASAITICNSNNLPSNLQTGLVGYWPFCGNANDESGNGNNGTVNGAILTSDRNLNINSAYYFNGRSFIDVPNSSLLRSLTSEGTISAWSYSNVSSGSLVCKSNSNSAADFRIHYGSNSVSLIINGKDYNINHNFPVSQWFNLVMTYKNSTAKLYVNGIYIDSLAIPSNFWPISKTNNLEFGRDPHGITEYHNGKIDDIGIWNRALTDSEIQQLFSGSQSYKYAWSTGDTTSSISVAPDSTTTYLVTISNGIHSCVDSVTVTVNNPQFQFAQDTITTCGQDSVLIDAGVGFASYNWSNGDSTQTTYAKSTGMYSVQVSDSNGCSAEDSVFVSIINGNILQNDTIICKGDSVSLSVSQLQPQALTICNGNNLPSNLQTGLVGYWPFCGNANDESGNGNNGTVYGASLTTDRLGNINSAYSFNGSSNKIDCGPLSNIPNTVGDITQSAWVLAPTNQTSFSKLTIMSKRQSESQGWPTIGGGSNGNHSFPVNNQAYFFLNSSGYGAGVASALTSNSLTNDSSWHLVTGTKNGNIYKLYFDGVIQDSLIDSKSLTSNSNLIIGYEGCWGFNSERWFSGKIDDIGIWNRALSASEVQQLYSSGAQQTYQWSTGDTTSSISVSPDSTTTYYVTISNGIHSCGDSVTVTVNNLQFQLAQDTITSCNQDSVLLDAGAGFASYNWSNGDSTQTTFAKATGMHSVQVTDSNGCSAEDSVFVSIINDSILQNDTSICKGDSLSLSVSQLQPQALTICNGNNLPSNLQTGLVGYWPFCGNANDESGNGNNGTVNGATLTTDKFGNTNSAYDFSGSAQTIQLTNALIPGGQNSSFTIQTRVKFDNINNSPNIWGKTLFWGEVNFSVSNTGEVALKWANSITGNKYSVIKSNPGIIQPNFWYDIVVSFQNNQAIIFVNGNSISTSYFWVAQGGSVLSTSRVENSCNFNQDPNSSKFGARITGGRLGNYLDGKIDEFTVWNRALSNNEISQIYSPYFYNSSSQI